MSCREQKTSWCEVAINFANVKINGNINRPVNATRAMDCLSVACTVRLPPKYRIHTDRRDTRGWSLWFVEKLQQHHKNRLLTPHRKKGVQSAKNTNKSETFIETKPVKRSIIKKHLMQTNREGLWTKRLRKWPSLHK